MDQTIYRLQCGRDPLCVLHHPPLAGLHPEQLEVREIQRPQRGPEQQGQGPEEGVLRPTQLRRLPQTDPSYLRKAQALQGSSVCP